MIPITVVQIKLKSLTLTSAGKIFARKNGTSGTNLSINMIET